MHADEGDQLMTAVLSDSRKRFDFWRSSTEYIRGYSRRNWQIWHKINKKQRT